jgi:leader peptidase (prepilin peptidase) / N-methyltransferase
MMDLPSTSVTDGARSSPELSVPFVAAPFILVVVVLAFAAYPLSGGAVIAALFGALLVCLAAIDLERRIVPNRIVVPAIGLTLVARAVVGPAHLQTYVMAALIAGFGMFMPRIASRSAIGMGDVKLAILLGAGLGWNMAWAIALGFLCVFPVALVMVAKGGASARRATVPMVPFLTVGALIMLLGPALTGN